MFAATLPAYCRQYAGNIAAGAEQNFAFTLAFLLNWCNHYMKSFEISCVKLLTEQNFDFFRKKKHFLSFDFFWIFKKFSGKECLPAVCRHIAGNMPANSRKNNWKIIAGILPAICRQTAGKLLKKKHFGKKIEKLKNFHEFVFFSNETFFSKNLT